jgi:hypothetical protein
VRTGNEFDFELFVQNGSVRVSVARYILATSFLHIPLEHVVLGHGRRRLSDSAFLSNGFECCLQEQSFTVKVCGFCREFDFQIKSFASVNTLVYKSAEPFGFHLMLTYDGVSFELWKPVCPYNVKDGDTCLTVQDMLAGSVLPDLSGEGSRLSS